MPQRPTVIILAAGRGERFAASGGKLHKLQALIAGKPVLEHVLDAVRASGLEWHLVQADASRPGMGDSIAAGVAATAKAAGWLILPGDLPLIQSQSLLQIADYAKAAVLVPLYQGKRGHPVRFAPECLDQLLALSGAEGAASIVKAQAKLNAVAFLALDDVGLVSDVDTLADLENAQALFNQLPAPTACPTPRPQSPAI
jgi:molybdenum cofactor cytidylyltransferase